MPQLDTEILTRQLLAVLREAFEGPPEGGSYFVDNDPAAGFFGTLCKVGAEDASRPVGGSTIAAHAHHMVFALEASTAWIRGDHSSRKWSESWRVVTVDETEWSRMREALATGYEALRAAITDHAGDGEDAFGGAAGVLVHAAYHLGAIRQKVVVVRGG